MKKQELVNASVGSRTEQAVNWDEQARRVLRAELARAGVDYRRLAMRLQALGVEGMSPSVIANRLSRGRFTFAFFMQCMKAIGVTKVDLGERE